jgi:acyl transferase domain-containing protein
VIAGPPELVDAVIAAVAAQDRLARRVEVDVASHHPIIDPVLPQLRSELADLAPRPPGIPVFTTTGAAPVFDADYWALNLRNPVQFGQAVAAAGADHGTFVEVSPHPLVTYAIDDTLAEVHHHSTGTLARDTNDTLTFRTNLNATHTIHPPDTDHPPEPHPDLPTTPWRHTHHWLSPAAADMESDTAQAGPGAGEPPAKWDWSQVTAENMPGELEVRLQGMLAREVGVPASAVDMDRTFPELGLDSIMANAILAEGKRLLGIDLSATMFFNYPTISALAAHLAEMLTPLRASRDDLAKGAAEATTDSESSVLDALFDSVESAPAESESGTR